MMPRRLFVGALAIALLLPPAAGGAPAPAGVWPAVLASTAFTLPVAAGMQYRRITLATSDGPLSMHELSVNLAHPTIRLGIAVAHDQLISDDEPVSSMVLRRGAIAGINADYFDIHQSGMPLNIMVDDGRLLRSPWRFVALALDGEGTARIIRFRWTGTVVIPETGETRPLESYNGGLAQNGLIAISDVRGEGAPPPDPGVRQAVAELTPAGDSGRYFVKQVWSQEAFAAPVPKDELLLVGRGAGADWIQARFSAGMSVAVNLTTDPDWHAYRLAIGGGPVLVERGRVVEDPDAPAPRERDYRNPVIAAGVARGGRSLVLVEVDGRQPALSIGLTRPQLAAYMQRLGVDGAIAFDSGGSATMVVRLPGREAPAVVNSPSDGQERPVANALLVYSTAVPGPPARLLVNAGQPLRLFAGARVPLSVIAVDADGNPTSVPEPLRATGPPGLVTVDPDGAVTAGGAAGSAVLTLRSGGAAGSVPVSVVTRVARLIVSPPAASVAPGSSARFTVVAEDAAGHPIIVPDTAAGWRLSPGWLGTVSPGGEFAAGETAGAGTLAVSLGGATARVRVAVGATAALISRFDSGGEFRAFPQTVTGSTALVTSPSHEGRPSIRLEFHLDGAGSRAAYLLTNLPLSGTPSGISLWVYGDASGVWLRGAYTQANGERGTVTLARHVDWEGWRAVSAALPAGIAYPMTWTYIYVVETDPSRTPSGVLYLSSLRAIYPGGAGTPGGPGPGR